MTKEKFIKTYGNKRLKDVAGMLHIYLIQETIDKHYELDSYIMFNDTMKVKDAIPDMEHLIEFESEE
jgi:hypothetical protein